MKIKAKIYRECAILALIVLAFLLLPDWSLHRWVTLGQVLLFFVGAGAIGVGIMLLASWAAAHTCIVAAAKGLLTGLALRNEPACNDQKVYFNAKDITPEALQAYLWGVRTASGHDYYMASKEYDDILQILQVVLSTQTDTEKLFGAHGTITPPGLPQ